MTIQLTPELERFVHEQVTSGRFASADAVVAAGVGRMMLDAVVDVDDLDDEDIEAIEEADQEYAAGRCRPFKEVAAEIRRDLFGKGR